MPDDATDDVAKHSFRLQPLINLHAQITAIIYSRSGTDALPRRDESSGRLCAVDQAS